VGAEDASVLVGRVVKDEIGDVPHFSSKDIFGLDPDVVTVIFIIV
jgi:hypothetical protein